VNISKPGIFLSVHPLFGVHIFRGFWEDIFIRGDKYQLKEVMD
jgi:hypothetical protein